MSLGTYGKYVVFIPGGAAPPTPYYMSMHTDTMAWVNDIGAGPSMLDGPKEGEPTMSFPTAVDRKALGSFYVPWDYDDQTPRQMFMRCTYNSGTDVNVAHLATMSLVASHMPAGADPAALDTNSTVADWPTAPPAGPLAVGEARVSPWMAITDASGEINGTPVAIGDEIQLSLERRGTTEGGVGFTDSLYLHVNTIEIVQLVP